MLNDTKNNFNNLITSIKSTILDVKKHKGNKLKVNNNNRAACKEHNFMAS